MNEEFEFQRIRKGDRISLGPFTITARRVDHPIEAYAFRVECDGRVLVYSGDTAACDALSSSPAAPTCCWPRRRSATTPTTRPTST